MRWRAVWLSAGSLVTLAALVAARRWADGLRPRPSDHLATEVAPGVHALGPWGRTQTNAYLVRDGSSLVLVDAGWAGDGPRIRAALRSLPWQGPGPQPSAIVLTHAHPDHSGAARELAEAWGCPVYAHPAEIPIATGDFAAMRAHAGPLDRWLVLPIMRAIGRRRREAALAASSLAGVVRPLSPGGSVPGLDEWTWVHTPGHTPGHVAYLRPSDRVVITGDALLTLAVNTWSGLVCGRQRLSGPPWYTTWDPPAAAGSIGIIAALEPSVIAAGHGLPLTGPGTAPSVEAFAGRLMRGTTAGESCPAATPPGSASPRGGPRRRAP